MMADRAADRAEGAQLEAIERDAWIDLYTAAPAGFAPGAGLSVERLGDVTLLKLASVPNTQFSRMLGLGVGAPVSEAALDAALTGLRTVGHDGFFVHLVPWAAPSALPVWLSRRGLARYHRPWAKFRRGTAPPPMVPSDLRVAEIGADRAADFAQPVAAGFGAPPPFVAWLAALAGRPGWRIAVAYDGTEPVAGGALFLRDGVAWLGIAATRPEARGRGAQGALMRWRIRAAIDAGCTLIATETGVAVPGQPNSSYNNMRRCGFEVAYLRDNYVPLSAGAA